MPDDVLDELIGQARALDMDEVRRRLEERQVQSAQADAR
jgi:hypothetical protein